MSTVQKCVNKSFNDSDWCDADVGMTLRRTISQHLSSIGVRKKSQKESKVAEDRSRAAGVFKVSRQYKMVCALVQNSVSSRLFSN